MSNLRLLDPTFGTDLDTALRRFFSPTMFEREAPLQMRLDVSEQPNAYTVKADIPGAKKDDIHVQVDGNLVRIDAEVRAEKETQDESGKVLRRERHTGTLSRAFTLTQDVDDTRVQARYTDGVLTLELPKKASGGSRRITVE